MKSRYLFRAFLGLVAVVVLGAGVLTAGIGDTDTSNTETIAAVTDDVPFATTTTKDPTVARRVAERAAAEQAEREAVAAQAAADEAAAIEAAEVKAANELAYYKALEEQAAADAAAQAKAQAQAKAKADAQAQAEADKQAQAEAQAAAPAPAAPQATASARPAGVPDDSYWDRMARCETAGNWSHYPDGQWSGGLGIYAGTWDAWGGGEFASNAGYATRDQQIIVANRIATQGYGNVKPVGYSGWGCVKTIGYP